MATYCLSCRHLDAGYHLGANDDSMIVWCALRHWTPDWHADADDLRRLMGKARACADYAEDKPVGFDGRVGEVLG